MNQFHQSTDIIFLLYLSVVITFVTKKISDIFSTKKESLPILLINFLVSGFIVFAYRVGVISAFLKYQNYNVPQSLYTFQVIGDIVASACVLSGGSNSIYDFLKSIFSFLDIKLLESKIKVKETYNESIEESNNKVEKKENNVDPIENVIDNSERTP